MTTRTFVINVVPASTAPAWWTAQTDSTWAAPTTNTLQDVFASNVGQWGSRQSITDAYTGAAVDQTRGELILPANGGHADWSGNEIYRCTIKSATPRWYRVTDNFSGAGAEETPNADGKMLHSNLSPRSSHGWYAHVWGGGKVYLAPMKGVYKTGAWSTAVTRFRYADALTAYGDTTLTAAQAVSYWDHIGFGIPKTIADALAGSISWEGGSPAAYDKSTGLIWSQSLTNNVTYSGTADGFTYSNGIPCLFSINTANDTITRYNVPYPQWAMTSGTFVQSRAQGGSVIAHDLGVWIQFAAESELLRIVNLNNVTATPHVVATTGTPKGFNASDGVATVGTVYYKDQAGKRFILAWGNGFGATIRKLTVPADPMNSTAADWVWSSLTNAGSNAVTPLDMMTNGVRSKFNIIDDMGDGRSALVLVTRYESPVYVYKLPAVI